MKIVVSGDKHVGLVSDGVDRLEEQRRVLDFVVDTVSDADYHVDLGDLFDRPSPSPAAYEVAFDYFMKLRECRARSFFLVGNHDRTSRSERSALDVFEVVGSYVGNSPEIVGLPRVVELPEVDEIQFVLLPHVSDHVAKARGFDSSQAYLDEFVAGVDFSIPTIGFAHLDVIGSQRTAYDSRERDVGVYVPEALVVAAERTFVGHIHRYQVLRKVTVVGSAIHVDFGESEDEKGIVVLEVNE